LCCKSLYSSQRSDGALVKPPQGEIMNLTT